MASEPTRHEGYPDDWEPPRRVSVEEYLRIDNASNKRYEYLDGVMYVHGYPPGWHVGMAGGTRAHTRLIMRLHAALESHLADGPCVAYEGNLRLRVSEKRYVYPDAYVACAETEAAGGDVETNDATLVFEVLSPGTETNDLSTKKRAYRQLPSLKEYVTLATDERRITVCRAMGVRAWIEEEYGEGEAAHLESSGLDLDVDDLYRRVPLARRTLGIVGGDPGAEPEG
jgi:Uma2 family endonuclease